MKVKFINIGRNNANFERNTNELTYDWILKQVRPYLLSHNIDIEENRSGTLTVFSGMQTVGEIEVLKD